MVKTGKKLVGVVFDIVEFAVHDGPGIRTTVFMKGCSLSCSWCHNPEGLSKEPQTIKTPVGERISGQLYTPEQLASILNQQAEILRQNEGGVTFSGGEPLLQAEFVANVIDLLDNLHVVIDTSGYAPEDDFKLVIGKSDLIYFDLKIINPDLHAEYTGVDNAIILSNLKVLSQMNIPFVIRLPLIPGITDTESNFKAIIETIKNLPGLVRVDFLPYNKTAGAKYQSAGLPYNPGFDESRPVNTSTLLFEQAGIKVHLS
jgi:pyruvate formate lyase activating enzyme